MLKITSLEINKKSENKKLSTTKVRRRRKTVEIDSADKKSWTS